jgi:hypothetical protein
MQALRQMGGGVIIALVSVILVIGGISLRWLKPCPPGNTHPIPPTLPLNFPHNHIRTADQYTETPTNPATVTQLADHSRYCSDSPCLHPPAGWIRSSTVQATRVYSLAQRYKTTAENLGAANCLTSFDLPAGFGVCAARPDRHGHPVRSACGLGEERMSSSRATISSALRFRMASLSTTAARQLHGLSTTSMPVKGFGSPNVPTRTPVPGVTIIPISQPPHPHHLHRNTTATATATEPTATS